MPRILTVVLPILLVAASPVLGQTMPAIGTIDYYGLRHVSRASVEHALEIKLGDKPSKDLEAEGKKRLEAVPEVARAQLNFVCCDEGGKTILYAGIEERGSPAIRFHPAPKGNAKLLTEIVNAGQAFSDALTRAVEVGDAGEDDSQGYSLAHNPGLRAAEERYVTFAAHDLPILRDVLYHSSDADHRALAAEVIGYSAPHRSVVPDLEYAMSDPDSGVRNNAMRALAIIAKYGYDHPATGIKVSPDPFIRLLNSLDWTDRDKAGFALVQLTETRDPALLAELRQRALAALIEMARWKTPGHADMFCFILGRIAGMPDEEIQSNLQRGEKETIIADALKTKMTGKRQIKPKSPS